MKKILVPTDFSECAEYATQAAFQLAKKTNCEIHFLHVEDIPVDWNAMANQEKLYPEVNKKIKRFHSQLDKLLQGAEKEGLTAHKFLAFNKDYRAILEHIDNHQMDLVVMGSFGASDLKDFLVGSNTQKIVRMSPVPVLVIKDDFKLNHMAFVSDFTDEVMDQFKQYVSFVRSFNAKLSLLFINTPENFTDTLTIKIRMGNYAMHAPGDIHNTYIFNHHNFLKGLQAFCQEHQVDALGMITHGGTSGMHLFSQSLTERVVNHINLPVLTMHFSQ